MCMFATLNCCIGLCRYLYTLRVDEADKADKLLKTLPPSVKVIDLQRK